MVYVYEWTVQLWHCSCEPITWQVFCFFGDLSQRWNWIANVFNSKTPRCYAVPFLIYQVRLVRGVGGGIQLYVFGWGCDDLQFVMITCRSASEHRGPRLN